MRDSRPMPRGCQSIVPCLPLIGTTTCAICMLAFAALQYVMPPRPSSLGLNVPGVEHFQRAVLGHPVTPLALSAYLLWSRILLGGAWASYGLTIGTVWAGGSESIRLRWAVPSIVALSLLLAVLCPVSFSSDVYAYVANARVQVLYGANPYIVPPSALSTYSDPTINFVGYLRNPCVYGPVWLQLSAALIATLRNAGLWEQVVALKLLQATALIAAAWLGRVLAWRDGPGRGDLALLAIGLNPFLLIEGPGNGHNDVLMMALLLGAAVLSLRKQILAGVLFLGLSIGIKFVSLAALPWLILEHCRGQSRLKAMWRGTLVIALALTPTIAGYAPLWQGPATLSATSDRLQWGGDDREIEMFWEWLTGLGLPDWAIAPAVRVLQQWRVLICYVALTLWLVWDRRPGRWLDAWTLLSGALITWTMLVRYPWYFSWPLMVALTRQGHRSQFVVSSVCLGIAIMYSYAYL